ncbi:MAG TPA: hypothetical protein VFJ74_14000 [Gemmatimonadaceae bacterium]|nr:hypothetical protein [Gemmatimonadaceae bacterium]
MSSPAGGPSDALLSFSPESTSAVARLHDACMAAARHDRAGAGALHVSDAAIATLRGAVRDYVIWCKREYRLPPERVLVAVKNAMSACAPRIGHARSELVLRDYVFDWFLDAYFPEGRRRWSGRHAGSLSTSQWATLGEPR